MAYILIIIGLWEGGITTHAFPNQYACQYAVVATQQALEARRTKPGAYPVMLCVPQNPRKE